MRLTTWNVNGIRNPFSYHPWNTARTFPAMFDILGCDIVVMQELKIQRKDLRDDMVLVDGWDCYFSLPKHKKGYSGVAIYTRNSVCAPIKAEEGLLGVLPSSSGVRYCDLPEAESIGGYPTASQLSDIDVDPAALDAEGRCMVLEFPAFVLFGVYAPANSTGLRDDFRYSFHCALDYRIRNLLGLGKQVVLVGDLNVSRDDIDSASAAEDIRKAGITRQEFMSVPNRRLFNQLLIGGEVVGPRDGGREEGVLWDSTRGFHPDRQKMFTHWAQKLNARPGNFGCRIDFVLVSESLKDWIKDANIQEGLLGSDHCPVFADFKDVVQIDGQETHLQDLMNASGTVENGRRLKEWSIADSLPLSAKRLPEFDKRRSIKSMFAAPSAPKPVTASQSSTSTVTEPAAEPTASSSLKRPRPSPIKGKPSKKQALGNEASKPKDQPSLASFFTKASASKVNNPDQGPSDDKAPETSVQDDEIVQEDIEIKISANESSQKSWNALFSRPVAPLCADHNEPCISMSTKKKGVNQGRSFFICPRPVGPSGNKERNTEWRCNTFIWASDWQGTKSREK
ncbi:APN2 DNA lyase apurinic/apyrimidinic [Piedraia hortae CBS 480.64]|uniref:DNA-(apurinic or apyrimidinic site) endonuclease 2 n=1 Tax=Piedraia hortae CBS 480.64 TaxID=1314780 RepID=A0A6A7C1T1_9PEZI|nr:APN2 DNA lyase apurinic/apyrimidinic [Piedraia hortae CBS 480.64]